MKTFINLMQANYYSNTLPSTVWKKKQRENISILIEFIKVKCKRSVKTEQCKINTIQKEIIFKPFIYLLRHRSNQKHKTE